MSASTLSPTPTRLRQIAFVSSDLERSKHLLTTVLGTEVVFIDPRVGLWGLKNFLVAIGGDIIEVVSPKSPNTTASRLLQKRGTDSGYMLIMLTHDAIARRDYLTSHNLAKVIFTQTEVDSVCVQYHPKGIKGGVIPELDSHSRSASNPHPVVDTFSPWHACGPSSSYPTYSSSMKRNSHLKLLEVTVRLAAGDEDVEGAARLWETLFGVGRKITAGDRSGDGGIKGGELAFVNCGLRFVEGEEGKMEGIESVRLMVLGREGVRGLIERARREGVWNEKGGFAEMVGVRWYFEGDADESSKL